MGKEKFGAVVIDMQPRFLSYVSSADREKMFSAQSELLKTCAQNDCPIAVIETKRYGKTDSEILRTIRKAPRYKVFQKTNPDGFEKIKDQIDEWGVNSLCFMGVYSKHCIRATAKSASKDKKKIFTSRELIANSLGSPKKDLENDIAWFRRNGIYIPRYQNLIAKLTS